MKRTIAVIMAFVLGGIMVSTSADYKTSISASLRETRLRGLITLSDYTRLPITEANIKEDSLYIDERIVSGEDFRVGGAVASELGMMLKMTDLEDYSFDGATVDLDYQILLKQGSGIVDSVLGANFDFSEDLVPDTVPVSVNFVVNQVYEVTFTSGALSGNTYNIVNAGTSSWNVKDYFGFSSLPTDEPDVGDTFIVKVWEAVPLGVYNIIESKRVDEYLRIIALDRITLYDGTRSGYSSTTVSSLIRSTYWFVDQPFCEVQNSISGDNRLKTVGNSLTLLVSDLKFTGWNVNLTTNTSDALSVSLTLATLTINIKLANTTASKNTAALIETAAHALYDAGGNVMEQQINKLSFEAIGDWDTTTIASGETQKIYIVGGFETTMATIAGYCNYDVAIEVDYAPTQFKNRDIISNSSAAMGAYARMSRTGSLEILQFYKASADRTIAKSERYKTKVEDELFNINSLGLSIAGTEYTSGTDPVFINVGDIQTLQYISDGTDPQNIADDLLTELGDISYYPFDVEFIGDPSLQAGDWVTLNDTKNGNVTTLITHSCWRYRGRHSIRGVGTKLSTPTPMTQSYKQITGIKSELNPSVNLVSTFTNSWVNYSASDGTYNQAGYYKVGNRVFLQGMIKSGTSGQAAFTLDVGFRPPKKMFLVTMCSVATFAYIQIESSGVVTPFASGNAYVSLENLSFKV
jgi:hypothetical protein